MNNKSNRVCLWAGVGILLHQQKDIRTCRPGQPTMQYVATIHWFANVLGRNVFVAVVASVFSPLRNCVRLCVCVCGGVVRRLMAVLASGTLWTMCAKKYHGNAILVYAYFTHLSYANIFYASNTILTNILPYIYTFIHLHSFQIILI